MRIEFTNGASVSRFWKDLPDGELLAGFQYFNEAKAFAEHVCRQDISDAHFIAVDHGTGASMRYPSVSKEQSNAVDGS